MTMTVLWLIVVAVMLVVRPFAMKVMDSGKMKTNLDEIAGQKVRVLEEINNSEGTGKVMYRGVEWMARSVDDAVMAKDSIVTVQSISGVKLMVTK